MLLNEWALPVKGIAPPPLENAQHLGKQTDVGIMSLGLASFTTFSASAMMSGLLAASSDSGPIVPLKEQLADPETRATIMARFADLAIAPDDLPRYPGGPLGLREFRGVELRPTILPRPSKDNFLIIASGGDCRGYNCITFGAADEIRQYGLQMGRNLRVFGSPNGFSGLTNPSPQILELKPEHISNLTHEGELLLATGSRNRDPFETLPSLPAAAPMKNFLSAVAPFLGGLIVIGGGGTLTLCQRIVSETSVQNITFSGATMDGDIPGMKQTTGFESSLAYVVNAIRALIRSTGSCNKVHIVQTMGGDSGRLPLQAAISSGARAVIIPELGCIDLESIYYQLFTTIRVNKGAVLVIGESGKYRAMSREVHEFSPRKGSMNGKDVEQLISILTTEMNLLAEYGFPKVSVDARQIILGHPQRQPENLGTADLNQGTDMGRRMARAAIEGVFGKTTPFYADDEAYTFAAALAADSRQRARDRVLKQWSDNLGRYYPDIDISQLPPLTTP